MLFFFCTPPGAACLHLAVQLDKPDLVKLLLDQKAGRFSNALRKKLQENQYFPCNLG